MPHHPSATQRAGQSIARDKLTEIDAECAAPDFELDDIKSAGAPLDFAHERLCRAEPLGQLHLRYPPTLARVAQRDQELLVTP